MPGMEKIPTIGDLDQASEEAQKSGDPQKLDEAISQAEKAHSPGHKTLYKTYYERAVNNEAVNVTTAVFNKAFRDLGIEPPGDLTNEKVTNIGEEKIQIAKALGEPGEKGVPQIFVREIRNGKDEPSGEVLVVVKLNNYMGEPDDSENTVVFGIMQLNKDGVVDLNRGTRTLTSVEQATEDIKLARKHTQGFNSRNEQNRQSWMRGQMLDNPYTTTDQFLKKFKQVHRQSFQEWRAEIDKKAASSIIEHVKQEKERQVLIDALGERYQETLEKAMEISQTIADETKKKVEALHEQNLQKLIATRGAFVGSLAETYIEEAARGNTSALNTAAEMLMEFSSKHGVELSLEDAKKEIEEASAGLKAGLPAGTTATSKPAEPMAKETNKEKPDTRLLAQIAEMSSYIKAQLKEHPDTESILVNAAVGWIKQNMKSAAPLEPKEVERLIREAMNEQ